MFDYRRARAFPGVPGQEKGARNAPPFPARRPYFAAGAAGGATAAVVVPALRLAAIASSSILMPSCEIDIDLFSDSVAWSGL